MSPCVIDLVIITLISSKQQKANSKLRRGAEGARLPCRRHMQSMLKYAALINSLPQIKRHFR